MPITQCVAIYLCHTQSWVSCLSQGDYTCSDIWTLHPPSSCRQTADHSLSWSTLPGSAPPLHGPWCQVRVPNFDSPTSKFTTDRDGVSLLPGSCCHFFRWAAWTEPDHLLIFSSLYSSVVILTFPRREQVFTMQSCARCGFVVYPAEKINCIDQVTVVWTEVMHVESDRKETWIAYSRSHTLYACIVKLNKHVWQKMALIKNHPYKWVTFRINTFIVNYLQRSALHQHRKTHKVPAFKCLGQQPMCMWIQWSLK